MKTKPTKPLLAILAALLGLCADASALQPLVLPQGDTVCGLNLVNPVLYSGSYTASVSTTGVWTYNTTALGMAFKSCHRYTIEFPLGEWSRVTSGGGKVVKTGGVFSPTGSPPLSGTFIIREVMTVADVFGAIPGIQHGTSPTNADSIEMPSGVKYFFHVNKSQWMKQPLVGSPVPNQSGAPIFFVQGFIFHRKGTGTLNLNVPVAGTGVVKQSPTWMDLGHGLVRGSAGNVGIAGALVSTITSTTRTFPPHNLVSSGLDPYLTNGFSGPAGADQVSIQNAQSVFDSYYYDDALPSWADLNSTAVNGLLVDLPSGVVILRANPYGTQMVRWNP